MKTREATGRAKKRTRNPTPAQPAESDALQKRQARNARLIALLDTFDAGDPEEQRRELAALQTGIEAARPGQRQVFGDGFNP